MQRKRNLSPHTQQHDGQHRVAAGIGRRGGDEGRQRRGGGDGGGVRQICCFQQPQQQRQQAARAMPPRFIAAWRSCVLLVHCSRCLLLGELPFRDGTAQ